jgi:hypothetical protein
VPTSWDFRETGHTHSLRAHDSGTGFAFDLPLPRGLPGPITSLEGIVASGGSSSKTVQDRHVVTIVHV